MSVVSDVVAPGSVQRVRVSLYVAAVVTVVALASSALVLVRSGVTAGAAVVAALPPSLLLGAIGAASRYLCRAIPLRSSSFTRLVGAHAVSGAAAAGLWLAAWNAWMRVIAPSRIALNVPILAGVAVLLYGLTATIQYLVLEVETSREAEQAVLRYQLLAREAELRAFKAQVDPHFLFNSLNAVAALCGSNPQQAREMAQRLADFFRLMLRVGGVETIALGEELDLVSRYLAIEKVRFGSRLEVAIEATGGADACRVPPLLLQPLVENAVRHGIASVLEGGVVSIAAILDGSILRITIENPADPDREVRRGEGIGLQNARGRLRAVTGGAASLRTSEAAGRFRVEIEIPQ